MSDPTQTSLKYISIPLQSLKTGNREIDFDIYIKLSEDNYAHLFSRTTGIDYKRLFQYAQKGVTELYIRPEDELLYQKFSGETAEVIMNNPSLASEKKVACIINMTEQTMVEIFSKFSIDDQVADSTKKVVNNYVELLHSDPKSLVMLMRLVSHGEYLYYHSIAVAIFSIFLSKASGLFNRRLIETIGLGAFLHDLGCVHIPREITESPHDLTAAQWKVMRAHPKVGLQMLEKATTIPDEVRYIVYQHHEEPGAQGYPNQIGGNAIYYPAKIVSVADGFSALISKRPFRAAFSTEQAMHIIQSDPGKFDREIVRLLITLFTKKAEKKAA